MREVREDVVHAQDPDALSGGGHDRQATHAAGAHALQSVLDRQALGHELEVAGHHVLHAGGVGVTPRTDHAHGDVAVGQDADRAAQLAQHHQGADVARAHALGGALHAFLGVRGVDVTVADLGISLLLLASCSIPTYLVSNQLKVTSVTTINGHQVVEVCGLNNKGGQSYSWIESDTHQMNDTIWIK